MNIVSGTYDIIPPGDGLLELRGVAFRSFFGELDVSTNGMGVGVGTVLPAFSQASLILLPGSKQVVVNDLEVLIIGEHVVRGHDGDEEFPFLGLDEEPVSDVDAQAMADRPNRPHQFSFESGRIVDHVVVRVTDPCLK